MTPPTRPSVERERNETARSEDVCPGSSAGSRDEVPGPGQYADPEWNDDVYYNWHRYYIPHTGRYNRADPITYTNNIPSPKIRNFLGFNRNYENTFFYSNNNPLLYFDNEGLECSKDCPDCPSGYWTGSGHSWSAGFALLGYYKSGIELTCTSNSKTVLIEIKCPIKWGPHGFLLKLKKILIPIQVSFAGVGMHCWNAYCVNDFTSEQLSVGGSLGAGIGAWGGGGSISGGPSNATCATFEAGVGIGFHIAATGCTTTVYR